MPELPSLKQSQPLTVTGLYVATFLHLLEISLSIPQSFPYKRQVYLDGDMAIRNIKNGIITKVI